MHKFDKILVQTIFCCSLNAYLTVVMIDHFYFVRFEDRCEILSKCHQIYVKCFSKLVGPHFFKNYKCENNWVYYQRSCGSKFDGCTSC